MDDRDETDAEKGRSAANGDPAETRLTLAEERIRVAKRTVDRGGVRVSTVTEHEDETVETPLRRQWAKLDRMPVERFVEAAPEPRVEGDTVVISVVEERAVVTKQLVVIEEVRVRLDELTETDSRTVRVAKQHLRIDEIPARDESVTSTSRPAAGDAPARPLTATRD
ncbi:YsnF/AvaK domain-containing protein [Parvularcula dongshanensis]|uniref:Uncharacterized protein (TIGR02271 family) n=1 Tax=Parvularcula dongshanensis TaxID=1173995 RepID=A0A840I3Z3_9PROT|nr:YsnF/AvaK domain-containing protein [Parvularcula dongshanensis]MBB4658760.1 uncharacterized protein (TIGR02271 family) [Parvularcula dongshanensis]